MQSNYYIHQMYVTELEQSAMWWNVSRKQHQPEIFKYKYLVV